MNESFQVRKLPMMERVVLVKFLEVEESWKKLMSIIPQTLSSDTIQCDITLSNPAKYRSEDFHTIQKASNMINRVCSEILLREWSTSGRVLPTLGHLKYLLEKAQLFHAADYVTVDLLKQERPARPRTGPGAPIVFNSEELEDSETKRIQKILDEINYPSSAIENINKLNSINTNLNYTTKDIQVIPKIIISESPDVEEPRPSFNVPIVVQVDKVKSEADLIKFSKSVTDNDVNANVPDFSSLLTDNSSNNNIPAVVENISDSDVHNRPNLSSLISSSSEDNIPSIPVVVREMSNETNRPNLSSLLSGSSEDNIPALSGLNLSSSDSSSSFQATSLSDNSSNFPNLSNLLNSSDSKTNKTSRSCSSPLPNLSLNTPLPHFTYCELKTATSNFDETPLAQGGRFLGSGSFGKVFLAENLHNKPLAVKKLLLENEEVVQVDDRVTKQFIAEVEILSKYKHENLVTLLGYSCDGMTYCLLYEFVPGGSLKDRLQKHELIWTERFYIALGTGRAIAYLHTAYSTPLIHRDIKSANILLDVSNKPKLCDFGLIKHSRSQNTHTATTILGTSAYMAPEAFRGDISVKLDTFSYGVVLLELLTSKPPIDENREGIDLVTHVDDCCKDDITPLLDTQVGSWCANDINFGQKLYKIAQDCLQEKKQRPAMTSVCSNLGELIPKCL